ncbi:twitchin-like isoform X1 [Ylistrum balloti]|uniref:twitchin-like isoform X1 n=2 Tax=Ylistrum balloti TaxID=509963 RepID=UPI00290581B7|nr:twitchin-like isoform X1 [Ylistrum balloti]
MPERRKIKTSKHKVVSSTPRKGTKVVRAEDVESDGQFDDFNILDTSTEAVCVQPEFDDGTSRPVFQMKLEKTVVEEGASAQMECVVAGIPPPKVLWLKNNRPLMATDRCRVIVDGDSNILEFPRARADDTAVYTARAMNVNGSTISTAELYVGDAQPSDLLKYREGIPDNEFRTPAYFFQMKSCQVEEGRLARFDCRVVAYPKPDIIWMKDGKVLTSGERFKLLNFNDEIYSLLIQAVETDDEGRYTCWAHNKYGEAMTEAYLNVLALHDNLDDDMAPKFLTKFYDQTVTEGVPCDLQCMIAGKPQPSVQWLHDNIEVIPTAEIAIVNQSNFCSLKIKEVSKNHAGKYACLLKNGLGEASCSAGITIIDKKIKGVPMLPKFLKKLCDVTAKTNEDFEFEVVVVGEPKPKITWQYNHKPISGSHRRIRKSHEGDVYRLTISDVRLEDDGKFTCKAANSEGEVYCSCNLLVKESRIQLEPAEEPSFTQKDFDARYGCAPTFLKKMEDVTMPSGQSAKFECRIMGIPEPTVQWFKNGVPISQGKKYWMSQDSAGNCGLQVYDVSAGDEGIYTCTLTNPAGEISTNASLRIGKPKESMERDFPSKTTKGRRLSREDMLDSTRAPTMSRDEPTMKSTRPDTVRLSWAPAPTSGLPKDARNIRYIVESKALPNADWRTIGDGIHSNTYMAKNLNPEKEYAFRVRAENQFGQSEPTQPARLERIKIDEKIEKKKVILPESKRPPSLPSTKPVITDYGKESVRLAWKPAPPPVTIKKPLPVSYRVETQELPSTDWLPMASGLSTPSYYLPQLQDHHDYNIRVRAENKYGVSEPSEPLWLPRARSFPGVPVRRPEIIEMEPEYVKLSWERVDVPPTALDEEPLTYMLEMQEPANRDWREIAQGIREPHYVVRDLQPGNDYRFRVRSRSLAGPLSEPSPATSLYRTMATTRVPIDRIQLDDHELDTEGISLSWNRVNIPPYHRDDEPLLYSVEMMEQPIDDWRPVVSGIPTQRYRVTDLAPDRDYKFRVRALSSYGISPPSYALPVSYRRPLPSPSRPIKDYTPRLMYDDTDSLALAWQPPTLDSTRPLRYRVQMQAPPSMDWRTMASDIPDTRYRISGLGPSRDYMFRVVPETSLGQLDPLPPVSLSSLPTPRTFHPSRPEITDIEPTSLGLSWKRPVVDMYTPLTYNIEMQEPPSLLWRNIHSGLSDTHYRVGGLQPSRDYMFRIVPVTTSGQLEPLPPVSISSMPVIPRMQNQEPNMTEVGRDSIKLSWRPAEVPFYRRQPLPVHYTVEMRTLPSSEWIPAVRRLKETSYIVKGLNPKNDYEFRVKADTDYGSSSPTYPVTVRRKAVPVFPRREPIISNVSPDSITLSWQPATLPGHSTRIPVYQIEIQDPPSIGQWRPLTNNVSQTSYNVVGLRPDRDYLFRVRAKVDSILGEPTLPVYLMRRCGPPRMPTDHPYVHDIQPTSVRLQWRSVDLSPRHTDYSPVTYRLEVQEGTRSDWVTLAGRIPHTDFHVTNLTPDQEYSFRVRAENKYGVSEPTNLVHIKRRAVAPTLPQDEPLLYDVGAGSLTLSWRSAEVPSFSTSPVTYSIYVQESPSSSWLPMVKRIPHTWYTLHGIRPDRDYTFRVQAENEFGVSRPTLPVRLFHTDYKAPIEIPEIEEFDEKSSSINLRWRPRSMTPYEGEPLRYHVESWEPRKRVWKRLASDIPDTSYRVTGVSSNLENIFRVRAQTKAALSEPTYPISLSRYLYPMPRPQLHDLEPEAVRLSWSPYQHSRPRMSSLPPLPSLPRRYEVELRELGSHDWRSVATVPDTSFYYRGLRPRQDYQFRVRGISDQGPLDLYSSPVTLYRRTALPRVPLSRPEIMSVQDETVDLSWSRVDIPATQYDETPLTYIIETQQLPGYDWMPVARGIPDTSYRVTGLRRNQDYAFRIRGELPSGLSEPSPYVPVYRRPSESKIIIKKYPSMISTSISPRTLLSQYYSQQVSPAAGVIGVKTNDNIDTSTLHASSARKANVCVDRHKILTRVDENIKTRRDFFLAELERIDTEWQKKHLKRVRKIDLKPPLPPKHAPRNANLKPPMSPRSRREQFLQDSKKINAKIPVREKSLGFSSVLEKFKKADVVEKVQQPRIGIQEDDIRKVACTELTKAPSTTTLRKKFVSDLDLTLNKSKPEPYIIKDHVPEKFKVSKTDFYAPRLNLLKKAFDDSCTTTGRHYTRPSRITENAQKYVSRDYHRASSWHGFTRKYPLVGRSSSVTRDLSISRSARASSVDLMSVPKRSQSCSVIASYRDPSLSRIGLSWYHDRTSSNMPFARNLSASAYDLARKSSVPPMALPERYSSSEYLYRRDNSSSRTRDAVRSARGVSLPPVSALNKYSSSEYLSQRDYSPSVDRDSRRSYRGMSQPPVSASDRYSSSEYLNRRDHSSSLNRESKGRDSSWSMSRAPKSYRSKSMSVVDGYVPVSTSSTRNTYVPKTKCFRDHSPSRRLASVPATPPRRESSPFISRGSPLLSRKGSVEPLRHSVGTDRGSLRESSIMKTRHLTPQRLRTMSVSSSCGSLYDTTPSSSRAPSVISRSPSKDYSDSLKDRDTSWIRKVVSGFRKNIA